MPTDASNTAEEAELVSPPPAQEPEAPAAETAPGDNPQTETHEEPAPAPLGATREQIIAELTKRAKEPAEPVTDPGEPEPVGLQDGAVTEATPEEKPSTDPYRLADEEWNKLTPRVRDHYAKLRKSAQENAAAAEITRKRQEALKSLAIDEKDWNHWESLGVAAHRGDQAAAAELRRLADMISPQQPAAPASPTPAERPARPAWVQEMVDKLAIGEAEAREIEARLAERNAPAPPPRHQPSPVPAPDPQQELARVFGAKIDEYARKHPVDWAKLYPQVAERVSRSRVTDPATAGAVFDLAVEAVIAHRAPKAPTPPRSLAPSASAAAGDKNLTPRQKLFKQQGWRE